MLLLKRSSAALAGAALTAGLAPFALWPLLILCPAILVYTLQTPHCKERLLRATLFYAAFFTTGAHWIYIAIHTHGAASMPLAAGLTALLILTLTATAAPWMLLLPFKASPLRTTMRFATLWVMGEWLRSVLFTGFPWLSVGYGHIDSPLAPLIPLLGLTGLSWLSVSISALLIFRPYATLSAMLFITLLFTLWQPYWVIEQPSRATVALLQGNVPQSMRWREMYVHLDHYQRMLIANSTENMLILPEMAVELPLTDFHPHLETWQQLAKHRHQAWVFGLPIEHGTQYENAVMGIGEATGTYAKQHLVPFGEYVPFGLRGIIAFFDLPMSDMHPGRHATKIYTPHTILTPIICYEVAFPDTWRTSVQDSDALLSIGNYAWFGTSIAAEQQWQMARFFAKAAGRPLLQVSNTGISGIIDATGHVQSQLPTFTTTTLTGPIPRYSGQTPWLYYGEMPVHCMLSGWLGYVLFRHYRKRRTKPPN